MSEDELARVERRVELTYRVLSPPALRVLNAYMVLLWRLGLGRMLNVAPGLFGRYMILTTTGRRTGLRRRVSVNYAPGNGSVFCVSGWGTRSNWYRNLLANPEVEVWIPGGRWVGRAEPVSDSADAVEVMRNVLRETGALDHLLAGIDYRTVSDGVVQMLTSRWPPVRISLGEHARGPGGPRDLAWVWPLAALALLGLRLVRRGGRLRPR